MRHFASARRRSDFDYDFERARLGRQQVGEFRGQVVNWDPMGDPWPGLDFAALHHRDDLLKILGPGIARGENRQLPAMEVWIVKRQIALKQPDKHNPSAGRS